MQPHLRLVSKSGMRQKLLRGSVTQQAAESRAQTEEDPQTLEMGSPILTNRELNEGAHIINV
jgi:hypothetical protein